MACQPTRACLARRRGSGEVRTAAAARRFVTEGADELSFGEDDDAARDAAVVVLAVAAAAVTRPVRAAGSDVEDADGVRPRNGSLKRTASCNDSALLSPLTSLPLSKSSSSESRITRAVRPADRLRGGGKRPFWAFVAMRVCIGDGGKESGELGADSGEVLEPREGVEESGAVATCIVIGERGKVEVAPPNVGRGEKGEVCFGAGGGAAALGEARVAPAGPVEEGAGASLDWGTADQ